MADRSIRTLEDLDRTVRALATEFKTDKALGYIRALMPEHDGGPGSGGGVSGGPPRRRLGVDSA